jgi:hypothetical protein
MSLRKSTLIVTVALALLAIDSGLACGDKFLIVGRGSRFQRAYVAVHPASLLLVGSNVTAQREIQSRLKIAGHRLQVVSVDQIPRALASARYDFILADFRDVANVGRVLVGGQSNTTVLPVIDGASKTDWTAAAKEYKCLLEDTQGMKGARHFLAALDLAMESKLKAKDINCDVK